METRLEVLDYADNFFLMHIIKRTCQKNLERVVYAANRAELKTNA